MSREETEEVVIFPTDEEILERVRINRNALLTASDWTHGGDSPLSETSKLAWATYRQALRDITDAPNIRDITWPVPPTDGE
jgi:hypothetical protein